MNLIFDLQDWISLKFFSSCFCQEYVHSPKFTPKSFFILDLVIKWNCAKPEILFCRWKKACLKFIRDILCQL